MAITVIVFCSYMEWGYLSAMDPGCANGPTGIPANISKLKSGRPNLAAEGGHGWGLGRGCAPP